MKTLLDAARSVVTKPEQALRIMLQHWQATRSPALAKLITRLGAATATPLAVLPTTQAARAQALATAARESTPGARSAAVAAFEEFARNASPINAWKALEGWVAVEPDPRVARMAVTLLTTPGAAREVTHKLRSRLSECLMRHADPSLAAELEQWASKVTFVTVRAWGLKLATRVQAQPVTGVDEGALAKLEQLVPHEFRSSPTPAGAVDGAALLDAIFAAPDDDAPRLAWADWLTERGDPRGEFIVLQINRLGGKPTKEARAREDELLATHRTAFLASLGKSIGLSGTRFERGFVTRCSLGRVPQTHREFALLEDVDFTRRPVPTNNRFPALRVARGVPVAQLTSLVELAPRVEHLELATASLASVRMAVAALTRPLRSLRVELSSQEAPGEALTALLSSRGCAQLEALEIHSNCSTWAYEPDTPPVPPVLLAPSLAALPTSLNRLTVELQYGTVRLTWKRAGAGLRLGCRVGRGNEYTLARVVAGALAGFVKAPLESMDVSVDAKNATFKKSILDGYLKPLRSGAKTITFMHG